MDLLIQKSPSSFSDRVFKLLERVEHRVARSPADREAAYRLRYEAYLRRGLMGSRADARLYDAAYDDSPDAHVTTTFIDGMLAGTIRVNVGTGVDARLPSLRVYSDVVLPLLERGNVVVEFTRFASELELSKMHSEIAYITARPAYMALAHFDADFGVTAPRDAVAAFHRRVFRFEPLCEPRSYPGLTVKCPCVGMDFKVVRPFIESRYPFFQSTPAERDALFGPRKPNLSRGAASDRTDEVPGADRRGILQFVSNQGIGQRRAIAFV